MPLIDERSFYWLWAKKTFNPALRVTGIVSLIVGMLAGFFGSKWPALNALETQLRWMLPAGVSLAFFLYRMVRVPFEILHELDVTREDVEDQLREKRNCQAIADLLTSEHHCGVHQLLHRPPKTHEEYAQWSQWVHNWNEGIFARMKERDCTPQDISDVRTIEHLDNGRMMIRGDEIECAVRMHEIRCERLKIIEKRYAKRAEELTMR